jgi:hypothetical protein
MAEFQAFPKIPRYTNEQYAITEKIDGTNACLIFEYEDTVVPFVKLTCQSRRRIITPDDDNFGFAAWAHANKRELFDQFGPGRHYGEWWGLGIQRGYGVTNRRFSPFNVKRWPSDRDEVVVGDVPIRGVPVLGTGGMDYLKYAIEDAYWLLEKGGSMAAPGFMNPEGFMIYLHETGKYLKYPFDPNPKGEK